MTDENKNMNAEVIAVYPNKVRISVDEFSNFISTDAQPEKLKVWSYLEIADDDNHKLIAIIESYSIIIGEKEPFKRFYIIEANPLGIIAVSYTHLRAHETRHDLVCRLLLEKKK